MVKIPIQNHIVGVLIILSGITDILLLYIGSPILANLYHTMQFAVITWLYFKLVYNKKSEPIALIGIGIYVAVLIYSIAKYGLFQHYTGLWTTAAVITVIHAMFYVFNIPRMVTERYFDPHLLSNMIFNASLFVYFFVALVIFFLFDSMARTQDTEAFKAFWSIHNAFNIIKNLGFALAFYYTGKRKIYMTMDQLQRIARSFEQEQSGE